MELTRTEIMPGVWLSHLRSDKFKTACMSLSLLTQLKRETAAMNALIPLVLRRGTTRLPDMEAISARLEELYGTAIEPVVRRIGEIQCIGFYASFPEGDFLPGGQDVLYDAASLMGELLLSPATRGGLLLPRYVDSEREKMLELIRSRINEKRSYSLIRCIEEMCCYEDFAVSRFGGESECEAIRYQKLTKQYRSLLQTCPIEIFYCGRAANARVAAALRDALMTLPRGEIDYEIGTDVRMNAIEAQPRFVEEALDVTQGKLVIGFRLGECMQEPDLPALCVFNGVFGSGTTSKLFMTVREKLQLCYYASSMVDTHKGLLFVASGIEFDKRQAVQEEIFAQLEAIRRGEISDEELHAARAGFASEMRALLDSQGDLEGFYLSQALDGADCTPLELAELAETVTREEVSAIAASVECDLIYFLRGGGSGEETDDEEDKTDGEA
ncbi:MAG: insulinase family protein [Oscillospiraceae bacterium]|nr:insulinase family protein [Oscillospiraceae bacterium]